MVQRLKLHDILVEIINSPNPKESRVYFQPPASISLRYPCIIYARSAKDEKFANNNLYFGKDKYSITVIDANPDSTIPDQISNLPLTKFVRHFTVDNLNHDVYNTYF